MQRLKSLLKWLALVLVVAVAGIAGWMLWTRNQAPQITSLTQLVTVERGNLVATIAPTGEVYAPRQEELYFDVNKIELTELNVAAGQQVRAGDVLARIDTETLERAVTQAEANLTIAQSELEKVQNPYTDLDLAGAQRAVTQAEVNLENAKKNLILVQTDSDNAQRIRDLEYEVSWYETHYGESLRKYEQGRITKERLDLDWNNLVTAKERLERALLNREIDLANAEDQVAQANYNLQKAGETLSEIQAGPDPDDIEVAQAKVTSAQAALEEAQDALEAATMVAPFDGTVMSVGAEVGDLVSSTTTVVTLADLLNLRVQAFVDETDISQVEIGQEVEITFDAFPGQKFQGKVLEVPLQGNLVQNILTYEVPMSLEGAEEVSVKPGMTANLKIVVGRRENVLLVPALAVQQGEEGNVVLVQDSPQGPAMQTRVEVGLSDGLYVEVVRGLNEGDQVVIEYQPVEEGPGGFFMMRGVSPGGGGPETEERRETLGIVIGVASVIALMALGSGTQAQVTEQFESLGSNLLSISSGAISFRGVSMGAKGAQTLTNDDVEAITRLATSLSAIAPQYSISAQVVYGNNNTQTTALGVTPHYLIVRNFQVARGRFIDSLDLTNQAKVAVLGATVAEDLFGGTLVDPLGKTIKINRQNYQVVGVMASKGQMGFMIGDDQVFIP